MPVIRLADVLEGLRARGQTLPPSLARKLLGAAVRLAQTQGAVAHPAAILLDAQDGIIFDLEAGGPPEAYRGQATRALGRELGIDAPALPPAEPDAEREAVLRLVELWAQWEAGDADARLPDDPEDFRFDPPDDSLLSQPEPPAPPREGQLIATALIDAIERIREEIAGARSERSVTAGELEALRAALAAAQGDGRGMAAALEETRRSIAQLTADLAAARRTSQELAAIREEARVATETARAAAARPAPDRRPGWSAVAAALVGGALVAAVFAVRKPPPVIVQPAPVHIEAPACPPPVVVAQPAPAPKPAEAPPQAAPEHAVAERVVEEPAPRQRGRRERKPRAAGEPDVERGDKALRQGRLDEALAAFRSALAAQPDLPAAVRGVAMVNLSQGHEAEAKRLYTRYLELAPSAPDAGRIRKVVANLGDAP